MSMTPPEQQLIRTLIEKVNQLEKRLSLQEQIEQAPGTLTTEGVQDAAFAALTDTATIDTTYNDAANQVTFDVKTDSITDTLLRNGGALSVIGRSANSTGDPADISAVAASGAVLRESGSVLGFGTVAAAGIASNAVTTAKILDANVTLAKLANIATDSLIGRDTALSGAPENILLNATLSMDGSGNLQRAALTGDISASAGSNTTAIGANKVLTAMIADAQLTLAKMADLAQSTIIGRAAGAGTGVPTALSVAQVVAIINTTLDHNVLTNLTTGDVHTQYALLAGRSGGQTLIGGTASGNSLTLQSSSNATKGKLIFGVAAASAYDEVNDRLGVGTNAPSFDVHIKRSVNAIIRAQLENPNASNAAAALWDAKNDVGDSFQAGIVSSGFTPSGPVAAGDALFQANGAPLVIRTVLADDIKFAANNTERMRINSAGEVGIGKTADAGVTLDILQSTLGNPVQQLASTATNDDPTEIVYQNRVATTNATVTTLHTFTVPSSTTYMIVANVVARRTGGSSGTAEDGAGYILMATIKNVAGTATSIGISAIGNATQESQAGWDATIDVTGATARVRVTGALNNNISWVMTARVYAVST